MFFADDDVPAFVGRPGPFFFVFFGGMRSPKSKKLPPPPPPPRRRRLERLNRPEAFVRFQHKRFDTLWWRLHNEEELEFTKCLLPHKKRERESVALL